MNSLIDILNETIDAGFTKNKLSNLSGISNTHINSILKGGLGLKGGTTNPGKDKIISILLSAGKPLTQINDILSQHDYRRLMIEDIPSILKNNLKRKVQGAIIPLCDDISLKLLLVALEKEGQKKILRYHRPSAVFEPDELYTIGVDKNYKHDAELHRFYIALKKALIRQRKEIFHQRCEQGDTFETFACKHCLEEYIHNNLEKPQKAGLIVEYFANFINMVKKKPDQHEFHLTDRCSQLDFEIVNIKNEKDESKPKVFFIGKKAKHLEEVDNTQVTGFVSDAAVIVKTFEQEVKYCRKELSKGFASDYPDKLIDWLIGCFDDENKRSLVKKID